MVTSTASKIDVSIANGDTVSKNNTNTNDASPKKSHNEPPRRRTFALGSRFQFQIPGNRLIDALTSLFLTTRRVIIYYILSPGLVLVASTLICLWSFTFYYIILPMKHEKLLYDYGNLFSHLDSVEAATTTEKINPSALLRTNLNNANGSDKLMDYLMYYIHMIFGTYIVTNVIFNYYFCMTTKNGSGRSYNAVVRQLASATGFIYPETKEQLMDFKKHIINKKLSPSPPVNIGTKDQQQTNNNNNTRPRQWMLLGPKEWGYCFRSNQPKPARAHYDTVTNELVLCFDHYCPWMYNAVGYFNYRYFVNFLIYVTLGMMYQASSLMEINHLSDTNEYWDQLLHNNDQYKSKAYTIRDHYKYFSNYEDHQLVRLKPMIPHKYEKDVIKFSLSMCCALTIGVGMLCFVHIFLISTAKTTLEFSIWWQQYMHNKSPFYRNRTQQQQNNNCHSYSLGLKRNWQQIYGNKHNLLVSLLPSTREPQFLPVPFPDDCGDRQCTATASNGETSNTKRCANICRIV